MSTGFLEDTDLRDFDVDEDPPCEIRFVYNRAKVCGAPSVVRVRFDCEACGDVALRFVCSSHYKDLQNGWIACRACFVRPTGGLTWKVI